MNSTPDGSKPSLCVSLSRVSQAYRLQCSNYSKDLSNILLYEHNCISWKGQKCLLLEIEGTFKSWKKIIHWVLLLWKRLKTVWYQRNSGNFLTTGEEGGKLSNEAFEWVQWYSGCEKRDELMTLRAWRCRKLCCFLILVPLIHAQWSLVMPQGRKRDHKLLKWRYWGQSCVNLDTVPKG